MPPRRAVAVDAVAAPSTRSSRASRASTASSVASDTVASITRSSRPSRAIAKSKIVESDSEQESHDDDEKAEDSPLPKDRSRAAAAAKAKPVPRAPAATKSTRKAAAVILDEEENDSDEADDADASQATISAAPARQITPEPSSRRAGVTADTSTPEASSRPVVTINTPKTSQARSMAPPSTVKRVPSSSQRSVLGIARERTASLGVPRTPRVPSTPRPGGFSVAGTPFSMARSIAPPVVKAPKTRLVIHKMILRDFKSYAGQVIVGPFHKSFSAVVGPNGSGKSNVIDSLLFVFGWRASKMRQGKLSELIHNSAGKQNLPSCTVEVWFREIVDLPGPDAYKVVPNSRLIVARTAYRNNQSIYLLNNAKSTFTEVTTILRGRGIDLDHKRFLILQGEVESIAQMPPKARNENEEGLLEYLEDIIGTSEFKTPIEEAAKKVEDANELRTERLGRLKIVQREKDSLESKKREAEEFLRNQNELAQRQSALWQVYMLECKDQMAVAHAAIAKLEARREEEMTKHAGSKAEIEALEAHYAEMQSEYEKIAKETEKVAKELARYEKEDVQLQEKRKHLETKKKKLTKSLNDDKHATAAARSTASDAAEEIETVRAEMDKLDSSLEKEEAELDAIRDSLKGKTEAFSTAIEKKQRELQPWAAKISECQKARDVATEERGLLQGRAGQAAKEAEEAQQSLGDLQDSNEAKREEVGGLDAEKVDVLEKIKQAEKQLETMTAQEIELRSKAMAARSKADEAKSSATSNRSRGEVLNGLTRQAELGMLKGFHGRLGNLGVIDDKHDVAISTACPGLDNIVVEGVETGQACIEHLRRNNLGRANFICLANLGQTNLSPIETPENVPRLFDLVRPKDPRFAPAFYHQLRDTLVATDLAHANRIAYGAKRWRVVTLDGQLIDKSGTMSGGGARVARGGMSSSFAADEVTPEQIARLERERESTQESLTSHVKFVQDMKNLLEGHRARVPQIEMLLEKIGMDLGVGEKRVQEAKRRVNELKSASGPDDSDASRISELDVQLERLFKELSKLLEKTSAIEADIEALQEKILEAGGVRLRSQKSKVDGMKEMIELSNERITKAEVAKAKAEKDLVKLEQSTNNNTNTMATLEEELSDLLKTISSKSSAVEALRTKVAEAQDVAESKQEARDEIKSQLDGHSGAVNAFRKLEMELKQKLDDNQRSVADNEKRLLHWQDKHSHLKLHRLESDDDDSDSEAATEQGDGDRTINAGEDVAAGAGSKAKQRGAPKEASEARSQDENEEEEDDGPLTLQEFPIDELRAIDKETIKAEIVVYEEQVQKGVGNMAILEEYRKREAEFMSRAKDLEQTTAARDEAKRLYDDLHNQRLDKFMTGFSVIASKLKETYQTITLGGNAELELVDSLDPFSGIVYSVMPKGTAWRPIVNLSGGQKTLASLALVLALHHFKPTPFYVLDEIDAALDFKNVSVISQVLARRATTDHCQFVVISHRNDMFERAARLVGVYKHDNCSRSLAIHNTDMHAPPPSATPAPNSQSQVAPGTVRRIGVPGSAIKARSTTSRSSEASTLMPPTPLAARQRQFA